MKPTRRDILRGTGALAAGVASGALSRRGAVRPAAAAAGTGEAQPLEGATHPERPAVLDGPTGVNWRWSSWTSWRRKAWPPTT